MAFPIHMFLLLSISASMARQCFKDQTNVNALCHLTPNSASAPTAVKGEVQMKQPEAGGLTYFRIKITGLAPNSTHGFHIHTSGDIFTQGCSSTGGHYNPYGSTHGGPTDQIRHAGDLGNVYADQNGEVSVVKKDCVASLIGKTNIIGRSIVLHAKTDDLGKGGNAESKKTGNAGARVACGIIFLTV